MFLTIIVALLILSVIIIVHELGHYLVAKKTGILVEEFGLGLPPRVWGKKIGETIYSVNLLPIGGFVRMYGEDAEVKGKKTTRQFMAKSKKVRALVIVSGVVMNFLLAVVVFSIVYTQVGIPSQTDKVTIALVVPDSPAQEAGLLEGDRILAVEGEAVSGTEDFIALIDENLGQETSLLVKRGIDEQSHLVVPRKDPPVGEGPLGVAVSGVEMKFYPFWQMPARGAIEGFKEAFAWLSLIVTGLGGMFIKLVTAGEVPRDVAGPVGIIQITGRFAQAGALSVLQFTGILSVNLAIINILPIPALDGGRLLFIGVEAVTRRRVKANAERWAHQIGMIFLLFLIVLLTYNDILRIFSTSSIGGTLKNILP